MDTQVTDLLTPSGDIADPYRSFIAKSRYARWDEAKGRRETWTETVDRYMAFMANQLFVEHGYIAEARLVHEVRQAILNHEVMPSMRALMTAGEALERSNIAGFNCFRGSEEFITRNGLRSFADTVGSDLLVLDGKGHWTEARIRSFGEQPLVEVVLRPGGIRSKTALRHRIAATPDHRWITENRGEVTDLHAGDMVKFVGNASVDFIPEAFIQGFGFGDGTLDNRGRARVRLCGTKDQQWLGVFEEYGHSSIMSPPSFNGDVLVVFHQGYFTDWKDLPDEKTKSAVWLASWLEGYIAADGHSSDHQPGLSSQNAEAIEFAKRIAPLAGYQVTGHNISSVLETNLGTRKNPLQRITLRRGGSFRVMEVNDLGITEEVFCAVVPDGHEFVLANGVHTGNCSYLPLQDAQAFDELLYILMNGTGVGYSVEARYVDQLPEVPDLLVPADRPLSIVVQDSKEGWALAFRRLLYWLWEGFIPEWDLSLVRAAGARLHTFGGRASGPEPLDDLFRFTVDMFRAARGRKLRPIEAHDLACKIASVVVVGGVRRSAMISLSDLDDREMAQAKVGEWWVEHPYRALANNSAVYHDGILYEEFRREWDNLVASGSGERGIFHRGAAQRQAAKYGFRSADIDYGTNPCSEIILRPFSFCNLSEVVVRPDDSLADLERKVYLASVLGTWQSSLTNYPYLRDEWRKNAEEERLLGVSLTGVFSNPLLNGRSEGTERALDDLRSAARRGNMVEAMRLRIPQSHAITCVKPSGTVSQLVDCESGLHPKHARFYVRRVRVDKKDPISNVLINAEIPHEEDAYNSAAWVFAFPQRAAENAIVREDLSAIEHLETWLTYQRFWCEHKPSVTVSVRSHEWDAVGAWVAEHLGEISGVSFLPYSDHTYVQAPYEECTEALYEALVEQSGRVEWSDLSFYETSDGTMGSQELACSAGSGGGCEVVDLISV